MLKTMNAKLQPMKDLLKDIGEPLGVIVDLLNQEFCADLGFVEVCFSGKDIIELASGAAKAALVMAHTQCHMAESSVCWFGLQGWALEIINKAVDPIIDVVLKPIEAKIKNLLSSLMPKGIFNFLEMIGLPPLDIQSLSFIPPGIYCFHCLFPDQADATEVIRCCCAGRPYGFPDFNLRKSLPHLSLIHI